MDNGKWDQALKEANSGMPDLPVPASPEKPENNTKALADSVEALYEMAEKNGVDREIVNRMLGIGTLGGMDNDNVKVGDLNRMSVSERVNGGDSLEQAASPTDKIAAELDEINKLLSDNGPTDAEKEGLVEVLPGEKITHDRAAGMKNKKHQMDEYISEAENINAEAEKSGNVSKQLGQVALLRETVLREQENKIIGSEN